MIASETPAGQDAFLESLTVNELRALPYLFEFWALPHQVAPEGDWRTWVVMGGRGAGKTRAGAEWVRNEVEGNLPGDPGRCKRIALVGETIDQVREVMIFGESGIMACTPPDRRPKWEAGRKRLVWPNGAVAEVYSAHNADSLRGPQFDAAWVDEIGCAAIDKGTNQPNRFLDPKSSESGLPKYSNGARDDLMQMQYLAAVSAHWNAPENNPVSAAYGGTMVEPTRMFVRAWDARPFPQFPGNRAVWSDGDNYARGHWLTGRVSARSLAAVIREVCASAGVTDVDVSEVFGVVRGYVEGGGESARAVLQPLLLSHGVDAIERNGTLVFRNRIGRISGEIAASDLAEGEDEALVRAVRDPDAEVAGRVRLNFIEADSDYPTLLARTGCAESEMSLVLTRGEGRGLVERWLAESRTARDTVSFALPPSSRAKAGDIVYLDQDGARGHFRLDRIEDGGVRLASGVRVEPGLYQRVPSEDDQVSTRPFIAPLPVWGQVLDLPAISASDDGAPWVAAAGSPWPGSVAVYVSADGETWEFEAELPRAAVMGTTLNDMASAAPGLWDRGAAIEVKFAYGALSSISEAAVFAGGNLALIGSPGGTDWEVFQFRDAELTGPSTWSLSHRLRGLRGTDGAMPGLWPSGSTVIVVDRALLQLPSLAAPRGVERFYRFGPAAQPVDHPAFVTVSHTALGVALKPYVPVHIGWVRDGVDDLRVDWTRQTRVDGDLWATGDVPLGEIREAYVVRVLLGGVVIRESEVTVASWIYTSADRLADGIVTPFTIEIAQLSDRFGPGHFGRIIVDV